MADYSQVSNAAVTRYDERFGKLGNDVRTLGWGSKDQQLYRFQQTLAAVPDFSGKGILDIGCGFADYAHFLSKRFNGFSYTGWDINDNLIAEAQKAFAGNPNIKLEKEDLAENKQRSPKADIVVMLGLLNFNLAKQGLDNLTYSRHMLKNAFQLTTSVLVVDFLSTVLTPDYPAEDFVYYHDPAKALNLALELTPKVVLKHDYMPIPQTEFMLFLYK